MYDEPAPVELVAAVARFLREQIVPAMDGALAFQSRVSANALDLVVRQLSLDTAGEQAERQRLEVLTGASGDVAALSQLLADAILRGRCPLDTPGLQDHLLATSLAKLAVDQPRYAGIRRAESVFGTLPMPVQEIVQ